MRHLTLCAAFAMALGAAAASAQTAADSALVDRVVSALEVEATLLTPLGPMAGAADVLSGAGESPDGAAVEAALRRRLLADPRPDRLRQALVHLEGPAHAALLRRAPGMVFGNPVVDEVRREMAEDASSPLAGMVQPVDTALVRRFLAAQDAGRTMARAMVGVQEALLRERPDLVEAERLTEPEAESEAEGLEAEIAPYVSAALLGTDRDVLAQAVAFRESAAGQYVERARAEAFLDVYVPYFAALLIDEAEDAPAEDRGGRHDEDVPTEDDIVLEDLTDLSDDPSPVVAPRLDAPPVPRDGESYVYDVVEVMPELIGGLPALYELVEYPAEAIAAGLEGRVIVEVVVDPEGRPTRLRVLRSPHDLLADAALEAVGQVRFTPGLQRGREAHVRVMLPVTFRLR